MLNTSKIEQLIGSGLHLIQKSEPEDAIILEEELEEFRSYCQEVFGRVARFHQRLTSWHPVRTNEVVSLWNPCCFFANRFIFKSHIDKE